MTSLPLRIAIYARYSSDLQNPSSVDDQVALCRTVIADQFRDKANSQAALVFSDAAISGSTMRRPGITRLLEAAKVKRIDMVVAEGLDRLSRSLKDIAALHETLEYYGVGIWTAHEGRISDLHIGLKGTMNAMVLRDLKARIRRGQAARVVAGYVAGSLSYGYRVVRGVVDERDRNVNGIRKIDEAEAAVIRRIFNEFVAGRPLLKIVADLNRDGIPSATGGLWGKASLIQRHGAGILLNEAYIGNLVYNRMRTIRDPITGNRRSEPNPEDQLTRKHVPALRIISDDLWEGAKARLRQRTEKPKKVRVPPILRSHNQHALTGWVKCGQCGGQKNIANSSRYTCSSNRYAKTCANARGTKEPLLLATAFEALYERLRARLDFAPAIIAASQDEISRRNGLQGRSDEIKIRIDRLIDAIEQGVDKENAIMRVRRLQDDLRQIRIEITHDTQPTLPDETAIRAALALAVRKIEMSGDIKRIRLLFKCVLGAIVLTPIADQRSGETLSITLREEGWPEFWRMITTESVGR